MAGAPLTQKDLDGRIEDWFRAKHQLDLDFQGRRRCGQARAARLLQRSGQGLTVPPLKQALVKLDGIWDKQLLPLC